MNTNQGVSGLNALRLFSHPHLLQKCLESYNYFQTSPKVDKIFSYESLVGAHEYLLSGKSKGKVLLDWMNGES